MRRAPRKHEGHAVPAASKTPVKQRRKSPSAGQPAHEKPAPKLNSLTQEKLGRGGVKEEQIDRMK